MDETPGARGKFEGLDPSTRKRFNAWMTEEPLHELMRTARSLEPAQVALLSDMAQALTGEIVEEVAPDTDILTPGFAENFANRLRVYHALTEQKFEKKAFEYAFVVASRYEGASAGVLPNAVAADADIQVDGARYSLKTEGEQRMSPKKMKVSKLSEARWIRDCETPEDFAREAAWRIPEHLGNYQRIFNLRAFRVPAGEGLLAGDLPAVRYEFWEIPREMLMRTENLTAGDFEPPTPKGSMNANLMGDDGSRAFRLTLDASVEKVTLNAINADHCRFHGSWVVPVLVAEEGVPG